MKVIPGAFQHALVAVDIDRKKIRIVVRKICTERRGISLLKDLMSKKRLKKRVIELVDF